jgi:hypothetical protein
MAKSYRRQPDMKSHARGRISADWRARAHNYLRGVNSDHRENFVCIILMPLFEIGFDVAAVVTTESPRLHQNYFIFKFGEPQRFGVESA